mgnify:CR=1 FL=1
MTDFEMQKAVTCAVLACLAVVIGLGSATTANADKRGAHGHQVVAESRYGNGTVVGDVRRTRLGLQVRTPGGNWIYCRRSCSETLRVTTVDFWENQGSGSNSLDQEDGLLSRWLRWERRY